LAALAVRLGYIVFSFGLAAVPDPDSTDYLNYAKNLVAGLGYTEGRWLAFRAPGYPAFIAAVYAVFGQSIPILKLAQTIVSALVPVLVYLIGLRVAAGRTAAAAGAFACVYFGLVYEPAHILSEATFTCLFALSLFLLLEIQKHKAYSAACGAALALTALTRPVGLLLAPFALLWLFIKFPAKEAVKTGSLLVLVFTAGMAPWWVRNYRVFGTFVPVCVETGYVLQGTRVPERLQCTNDDLPEIERDRKSLKDGITYLKSQDARTLLKGSVVNLSQFLYPFTPVYDLTYAFIIPFWLFGAYFALKSGNIQAMPLFAMFLYFPVAFVFCGTARHRHSMGPYFILLAAIGAEELWRRAKDKRRGSAALAFAGLWAALNAAVFIYSEPIRLLVKKIVGACP